MIDFSRIEAAARRAAPYIRRTPLLPLDGERFLKLECLQPTGSFKVRGFFAASLAAPEADRARGLLTVSAGNAAMACAYAAHLLGVHCRVFMYDTAPTPKIAGVRRWGGEPVLLPRPQLLEWMANRGWEQEPELFFHSFADEEVMAGHGGIGLELIEELPAISRVVVPVGGGGLITGIASAVKALRPDVDIIGVQSDGYPLWPEALRTGGRVALTPATIADGTTAPFDASMFPRLQECVDRWILVPEREVRAAIADLALSVKIVAEGAGALAYAALRQLPEGAPTVAIVSGGNISPQLLRELLAEPAPSTP